MRLFAVIPAAGGSRRMGSPKLLLPLAGQTVIARLLAVFDRSEVAARVVVVRPGDERLVQAVAAAGAVSIVPREAPPEMRDSVEQALAYIDRELGPTADDAWVLSPADHPLLDSDVFDRLLARWSKGDCKILTPTYGGRRGHPVFFRWSLAHEVRQIPFDKGLNWLVHQHAGEVTEFETGSEAVLTDLDTPEEYARLLSRFEQAP